MSHRLLELFSIANLDYSWVAKFLSLLLLPAAHEDIAIILGGYLVVNQQMPVGIVVVTIFAGMVASDLALYGIGIGARHMPWLSRLAVNERVTGFGDTLHRNLYGLAALGRVVPGAIFVIMIACGWTRVAFSRVVLASVLSSALYLPLMLYLVVMFGDALDDRAGLWTWPFLMGVVVAVAFVRYRVFKFGEPAKHALPSRPRIRDRFAGVAAPGGRYRARTVRAPQFIRMRIPPRNNRRQPLH